MSKLIDINALNKNNDYINNNVNARLIDNASKNLLPLTLENIKSLNTYGTWNDNEYNMFGVTVTVDTNSGGSITKITVNGTATNNAWIPLYEFSNIENYKSYILSNGGVADYWHTHYIKIQASNSAQPYTLADTINGFNILANYPDYTGSATAYIVIMNNCVCNNLTYYPMIRRAEITDSTFEPYYRTQKQLDSDLNNMIYKDDSALYINPNTLNTEICMDEVNIYSNIIGTSLGENSNINDIDITFNSDTYINFGYNTTIDANHLTINAKQLYILNKTGGTFHLENINASIDVVTYSDIITLTTHENTDKSSQITSYIELPYDSNETLLIKSYTGYIELNAKEDININSGCGIIMNAYDGVYLKSYGNKLNVTGNITLDTTNTNDSGNIMLLSSANIYIQVSGISPEVTLKQYIQGVMNGTY